MASREILTVYRGALRSTRIAFSGDPPALHAARQALRDGFEQERSSNLTEDDLKSRLQYVRDISVILRTNVVQGVQKPDEENKFCMF
jgi:uncharacterized membrane protein